MRRGILTGEEGDIFISREDENRLISSGLQIGESDRQNIDFIIIAAKGEFKEFPSLGVGVSKYVKSLGAEREMLREISIQLSVDGYANTDVEFENKQVLIEI